MVKIHKTGKDRKDPVNCYMLCYLRNFFFMENIGQDHSMFTRPQICFETPIIYRKNKTGKNKCSA